MANLDRRRHGASMEPQRARDVLSPGEQDDGRRCNDGANLRRRKTEDTVRGTLRADSGTVRKLRRIGRWPAIPDGQAAESQTSDATQINVVLNWFEELKQRVPVH